MKEEKFPEKEVRVGRRGEREEVRAGRRGEREEEWAE